MWLLRFDPRAVAMHLGAAAMFLCLAALLPSPALAQSDWRKIGDTGEYDLYASDSTLRARGNLKRMKVLRNYYKPFTDKYGDTFSSEARLYEYDCQKGALKPVSVIQYQAEMGAGRVVYSGNFSGSKWQDVNPGSVGEKHWNVACGF